MLYKEWRSQTAERNCWAFNSRKLRTQIKIVRPIESKWEANKIRGFIRKTTEKKAGIDHRCNKRENWCISISKSVTWASKGDWRLNKMW